MKPINTDWTPILTAKLRVLFNDGVSFSHIASELAMSCSAVIGKCNRLGLRRDKPKPKPAAFRMAKRPKWDPRRNTQAQKIQAGPRINLDALPPTPASDLEIPKRRRKNIWTLGPRDCKFPIGDPQSKDFFFCGARKLPALPYCAEHSRRCFQPAKGT